MKCQHINHEDIMPGRVVYRHVCLNPIHYSTKSINKTRQSCSTSLTEIWCLTSQTKHTDSFFAQLNSISKQELPSTTFYTGTLLEKKPSQLHQLMLTKPVMGETNSQVFPITFRKVTHLIPNPKKKNIYNNTTDPRKHC